jgi:hypothetical protein
VAAFAEASLPEGGRLSAAVDRAVSRAFVTVATAASERFFFGMGTFSFDGAQSHRAPLSNEPTKGGFAPAMVEI